MLWAASCGVMSSRPVVPEPGGHGALPGAPRVRTLLYYLATSGYDPAEQARRLAVMAPFVPEGYQLAFASASGGPDFLDHPADFAAASRAARDSAETLGPEQGEAIILGGALDPGLAELRARARLPVIGPGEAALFVAALYDRPLAIIVQDDAALEAGHRLVEQTRVKPPVVAVRPLGVPVRALVADLERGRQALRQVAQAALEEDGAAAIYLGSMTLPTLGLTETLRAQLGVPVFDPLRIAIRVAAETAASRAG
jgi:allantoin racemase